MLSPKPFHDPLLPKKPDEWRTEQNVAGHWILFRNGWVVFTARTEEGLSDWWRANNVDPSFEKPEVVLDHAIRRLR